MKENNSEFETNFIMIKAFHYIEPTHCPIYVPLNTLFSVTSNSIHLSYKMYTIIKVLLWMLNVSSLLMSKTQNYFQTLQLANTYVALTYLQYFKL